MNYHPSVTSYATYKNLLNYLFNYSASKDNSRTARLMDMMSSTVTCERLSNGIRLMSFMFFLKNMQASKASNQVKMISTLFGFLAYHTSVSLSQSLTEKHMGYIKSMMIKPITIIKFSPTPQNSTAQETEQPETNETNDEPSENNAQAGSIRLSLTY
tara:strand:+ start:570 stop:1040 length:471 start_codon:yes stop_codon:yes gene_type:complete